MGFKKLIGRYKEYEEAELKRRREKKAYPYKKLSRRANLKKKYAVAKNLATKKVKAAIPKGRPSATRYTRAINNPYGVKLPSGKNTLKYYKI